LSAEISIKQQPFAMSPSDPIKILHLEDNPRDAELIQAECFKEWPDCQIKLVDQRDKFIGEVSGGYDLILSDFNLINFNGLEALQIVREKTPATPFIFLSGTIGEDRAIEALRAGANDYVIKDRPKRLIPAMHRALNDAKLQREKHATEEQMLRVQRLENIGMLAAGIAHDFNNVLAPIMMGLPLLKSETTNERHQRMLTSMESSVQRGAGLVRQILSFAHGVTGETQLVQSKHLINDLVEMLKQTFPKNIRIERDTASDLWPIKVNPTQLHQVLLNLLVNARDAMPQGGTLRMTASNKRLDEVSAAAIRGARAGAFLCVEVSDTGTGIPPNVLERMWEPFFTTKGADRGTGLGLATVRGIVEHHEGTIVVQTKPGQGTTFQIFLPASPGDEAVNSTATAATIPRGHGELILVADDDVSVRDVTAATLVGHGYRVLAASDGTEALALFAPRNLEVRAVVTDLDMPSLDGTALAKVVHALNPSVRVLTVSGSSDLEELRRRTPEFSQFIAKPFTASMLLEKIGEMLSKNTVHPFEQ
jgi:signal transduction histidine kinase